MDYSDGSLLFLDSDQQGHRENAIALVRGLAERSAEALGPNCPRTLAYLRALALMLVLAAQREEASRELQQRRY